MIRGSLAIAVTAALLVLTGVTRGQEEPSGVHEMPATHAADELGLHGEHGAAEPEMESENMLTWTISALGWKYMLLLPASALLSFVLTAVLVMAGKGRTTGAAMGFIVAIPFLVGVFGMFDGLLASQMVILHSTTYPKPSQFAEGISMSLVTPLGGMLLMGPSYLLATVGLTVRALKNDAKP